jgi:drug/metabolite transporter (DMT)-like permease
VGGRSSVRGTGIPQLVVLGLIWGATFPIARVGINGGADPLLLVVLDLGLAAVVLAPLALATQTPWPSARSAVQSAGLGALLIGGINLPLYWGLRFATGGAASIVYATAPIVSLVVLRAIGSAGAIRRPQVAALALGLGGVVLLGLATTGGSLLTGLGAIAGFGLGAACQGVGAVLVGRTRPQGENAWGLTFQFVGAGAAALVVLPLLAPSLTFPLNAATLGSVAYVGLVTMVVGYTLFYRLIQGFGAVRANQVTFLNPVVALVAGVVAFGEGFQLLEAVALALIILALLLLQPSHRAWPSGAVTPRPPTAVSPEPARSGPS